MRLKIGPKNSIFRGSSVRKMQAKDIQSEITAELASEIARKSNTSYGSQQNDTDHTVFCHRSAVYLK